MWVTIENFKFSFEESFVAVQKRHCAKSVWVLRGKSSSYILLFMIDDSFLAGGSWDFTESIISITCIWAPCHRKTSEGRKVITGKCLKAKIPTVDDCIDIIYDMSMKGRITFSIRQEHFSKRWESWTVYDLYDCHLFLSLICPLCKNDLCIMKAHLTLWSHLVLFSKFGFLVYFIF